MAIRPSERISGNSLAFLSAAGAEADAANTGRRSRSRPRASLPPSLSLVTLVQRLRRLSSRASRATRRRRNVASDFYFCYYCLQFFRSSRNLEPLLLFEQR